jgi:hypothetical protein
MTIGFGSRAKGAVRATLTRLLLHVHDCGAPTVTGLATASRLPGPSGRA